MKRFEIITEADARLLDAGETVALRKGGHATPLAADTLKARRVTVVSDDILDRSVVGLAPAAEIRRVAIGSDHSGKAALEWGVYGVPETFVIDATGIIRMRVAGAVTESSADEIKALLKTGAAP